MKSIVAVAVATTVATAALAQDAAAPPKPITVSGSVGIVTDYRFRGVSQSDNKAAVQGGFIATHNPTGLYAGTWGSNLAGWGQFGGANLEVDLIGGIKRTFGGLTTDLGLTWYIYPGGADKTDFAEPYLKLSKTVGPLSLLAGAAYAPKQQALGRVYLNGANYAAGVPDRPGAKKDNAYLWGDASAGIPGTKATLKGHLGHSWGNRGLGPNGTSVTPTGKYFDWLVGVDYAIYGPITLSFNYVDTNITRRGSAYLLPSFSQVSNGKTIAGSRFVFAATAAF